MANKIPGLGDFTIPSSLYDAHEWMVDYLIDGELGTACVLTFQPDRTPCDNCFIDTGTRKSSHTYNGTGPQSFAPHSICPRCNGEGTLSAPHTETVRLRVYWDPKEWRKFGFSLQAPDGSALIIGYEADRNKVRNADTLTLTHDNTSYKCRTSGEDQPHGFRHNRYFIQMVERV